MARRLLGPHDTLSCVLILQLAHLAHGRIMISLLFVAVNSALLGRALFYSYKLFLDGISILFVRISNALSITVGEFPWF